MLADRIEAKWIDLFADVFAKCKVAPGDVCAVLSESQSRALNVQLAELALARLGAKQDGVLRNYTRHADGTPRDTVIFSIIDAEWQGVKRHLQHRLDHHA